MYSILRKILFLFDAELIHEFSVHSIKTFNKIPLIDILIKKCFCINDKRLERSILGLKFKNPVGLAADLIRMLSVTMNFLILDLVLSK